MTAPGQEPDEVMTATPGGEDDTGEARDTAAEEAAEETRVPGLDAVGDSHMPQDLREAERESGERSRESAAQERGDEPED